MRDALSASEHHADGSACRAGRGRRADPAPDEVQRVAPLRATVPSHARDGRDWDADGPPDPYVVVFRNGAEVFRSPVVHNSYTPTWDPSHVFADLKVQDTDLLRLELRDDDGVTWDPIGIYEHHGIPSESRNGGAWLIQLEATAELEMQAVAPPARLGMGVTYEYHSGYLQVVDVIEAGPAFRVGLRSGDRITAIDRRAVTAMNEGDARQGMDHGAIADVTLSVVHNGGAPTDMLVRRDAVYPAR